MSDLDRILKALSYGQPILVLPADQPDYETLTDLTMEQKAALPRRFHTPVWMDSIPGAWCCRVCWTEGVVTGWPCDTASERGHEVFGPEVQADRSGVSSPDAPAPRPSEWTTPNGWQWRPVTGAPDLLWTIHNGGAYTPAQVEATWGRLTEVLSEPTPGDTTAGPR